MSQPQKSANRPQIVLSYRTMMKSLITSVQANVPVALWSKPGWGKTAMVKEIVEIADRTAKGKHKEWEERKSAAKEAGTEFVEPEPHDGAVLYSFLLSHMTEGDFGIPFVVDVKDENGKITGQAAQFLPPNVLPFKQFVTADPALRNKRIFVFFDEADRASIQIQNIAMQLVNEKRVNGNYLADNVTILLAGNGTTDFGTNPLTGAMANRIAHLYLDTESQNALRDWTQHAEKKEVLPAIRSFAVQRHPIWRGEGSENLSENAFPSPRSWFMLSDELKALDSLAFKAKWSEDDVKSIRTAKTYGIVGSVAGKEFLEFLAQEANLPKIEDIISDPANAPIMPDANPNYSIITLLCDHIKFNPGDCDKVAVYVNRLADEPRDSAFQVLAERQPVFRESQAYQTWQSQHDKYISNHKKAA